MFMPEVDPLSNPGTSKVFLCIIKGKKNPKAIADFLGIRSPPVIQQLRRLQKIKIIELGEKEGKEQNYEVNWDNFLALFIDRAMREGKYEKTRKGGIQVLEDTTEDFDKIKVLKKNRYFKQLIHLYLQNVAGSNELDWSTISDAILNFESALQQFASFRRSRKFEDPEKQDFFDKMKLWYKRTLSVRTWMDLNLHDAIYKTLRKEKTVTNYNCDR